MLRDVIAGSGLQLFAEVGLIIFLTTFAVMAARVLTRRRGHYDELAALPLQDGDIDSAHDGDRSTQ